MFRTIRQIIGVAIINIKAIQRQPLWIVQSIISASAWALTMYAWGSTRALENLVLVYIVAGSFALGMNTVAQSIGWERLDLIYDSNDHHPTDILPRQDHGAGTILPRQPVHIDGSSSGDRHAALAFSTVDVRRCRVHDPRIIPVAVHHITIEDTHKHICHHQHTTHLHAFSTSRVLSSYILTRPVEGSQPGHTNCFFDGNGTMGNPYSNRMRPDFIVHLTAFLVIGERTISCQEAEMGI